MGLSTRSDFRRRLLPGQEILIPPELRRDHDFHEFLAKSQKEYRKGQGQRAGRPETMGQPPSAPGTAESP
jgi:hypothetical protein